MSFSQTNSIRSKKKAVKDNIASLPKTISTAKYLIELASFPSQKDELFYFLTKL